MRPWYDVVLIGILANFVLLKAGLIGRDNRLGWAMATTNLILGLLFVYSLSYWYDMYPWIGSILRGVLMISVLWCVTELLILRRDRWAMSVVFIMALSSLIVIISR